MIAGSGSAPRSPARAAASAALRTSGEAGVEAGFADELSFAEPLVRIAARAIARGWNISLLGCLSTGCLSTDCLLTGCLLPSCVFADCLLAGASPKSSAP